ncbi:MAG: methyltransferase domain-containing protein [Rhodospirillales bacterium]|nr:methyltransferase domain-containing protein [Rhodospirillales bacterium]
MHDTVKEYYGKILQGSQDLKTDACCTADGMPRHIKTMLADIHDEVLTRYYGCGLIYPDHLEGARILDLGCGAGRDCYLLSRLVGKDGYVVGVDMTAEQLEVANRHLDWHMEKYGYGKPNLEFHTGYIERLDELGLEPESFDIIVSNCVINLSPDKDAVLRGAFNLLKPGGELYFSDVYSDRRVPKHLLDDPVLHGECLSGALYWNDFLNLAKRTGFKDPRLVEDRPLTIDNEAIQQKLGNIDFYSATYRLFKLTGLEHACEDYGQAVIYKGGIPYCDETFELDGHHIIEKGKVFPVCGNTYRMLNETRFQPYFDFLGTWNTHFGIFPGCGSSIPFDTDNGKSGDVNAGSGESCC